MNNRTTTKIKKLTIIRFILSLYLFCSARLELEPSFSLRSYKNQPSFGATKKKFLWIALVFADQDSEKRLASPHRHMASSARSTPCCCL
jgi:hypothetical protein